MAEDDLGAAEYYRSAYNQDWFQEAHNRFTEVCRGYPVEFDQLVIDSLPQKDHVRILDIGAGSADQRVMRYLLKMAGLPQTIEYNYLDSSGVQAGKLLGKAHILGLDRLIRGIHITPFQNFTSTEQYDYVVAMHSWYGIGNDESQIKKYCDMIADNGTGLFIIAPNNDFGGMLNKHFYGRLHGNRKGNHSYDISNRVRAQLLRHAESVNVDIMQEAVICKDDVIDCTANLTLLGRTLVEFFLMKQYESIPSDVRQDLTRFIQELPAYLDMTNYVFEVRK